MKAIIVSDTELRSLLASLELAKMRDSNLLRKEEDGTETVQSIHRAFHYVVTRWITEVGGDPVRF